MYISTLRSASFGPATVQKATEGESFNAGQFLVPSTFSVCDLLTVKRGTSEEAYNMWKAAFASVSAPCLEELAESKCSLVLLVHGREKAACLLTP